MVRIVADAKRRKPIRLLWTDSGAEFTARKFQEVMRTEGIPYEITLL